MLFMVQGMNHETFPRRFCLGYNLVATFLDRRVKIMLTDSGITRNTTQSNKKIYWPEILAQSYICIHKWHFNQRRRF